MSKTVLLAASLLLSIVMFGQDTLPSFTLKKMKGKVFISWVNPYNDSIRQLSVQRSFDSQKQFKSIITMPDPTSPQNGYVDAQPPVDSMYYRIYILLDSGKYIFSKAIRPLLDTALQTNKRYATVNNKIIEVPNARNYVPEKFIYIKKLDSVVALIPEKQFKRYKDSLNYKTKDTIFFESADTLMIRPFVVKEGYRVSKYIFTEKEGRVKIALPDAEEKKYMVKFFEEDSTFLFEIKHISQRLLMLDKSNFVHAGWFRFELYEDGHLKEKQKLYIPKDF